MLHWDSFENLKWFFKWYKPVATNLSGWATIFSKLQHTSNGNELSKQKIQITMKRKITWKRMHNFYLLLSNTTTYLTDNVNTTFLDLRRDHAITQQQHIRIGVSDVDEFKFQIPNWFLKPVNNNWLINYYILTQVCKY